MIIRHMRFACWVRLDTCTHTLIRPRTHLHAQALKHPRACVRARARAHAHTHTQKYVISIVFHGSSGFVNAPHCCVTRTLRLLFINVVSLSRSSKYWATPYTVQGHILRHVSQFTNNPITILICVIPCIFIKYWQHQQMHN
jgi:hypothetical protein